MGNSNLKLLAIVGAITLIGQILSMAIYPLLSRFLPSRLVSDIGVFDANILFITGLLGFGLNVAATRNIATGKDVRITINETQSARITLSILFFLAGVFGVLLNDGSSLFWIAMMLAPVIALNYDFILYGLGKPLQAAYVSFLRVAVPLAIFLVLVIFFEFGKKALEVYVVVTIAFVLIASFFVCKITNLPILYIPNFSFYKLYCLSFYIGISGVVISIQRFGFINLMPKTINSEDMVVLLFSIKFFLFIVAAKRMLVQTFYTKLTNEKVYKFISLSSLGAGAVTCVFFILFSEELSNIIFNSFNYKNAVILLGAGVFLSVFFIGSDSLLLLKNRDKEFLLCTLLVCSVFICFIIYLSSQINLVITLSLMIFFDFILTFSYWLCLKFKK